MRKVSLFLSLLLINLVFAGKSTIHAQEESSPNQGISPETKILPPDYYPRPDGQPSFLGQDHNYSVVFRGNGEAVVSLKVVLTNREDSDLSQVSLRVPKIEPKELAVYQVIRDPQCIRYRQPVYDPLTRTYGPQVCEEYQEPDYYGYGNSKYQKAKYSYSGDTLGITLPQPIKLNASGSFFVYFRAFGYAKKNVFGAYKYTFESLKVEDSIRNLQVGISTDSDLVLRGAKGEVDYRFSAPEFSGLAADGAPSKSTSIDRFYGQIGQGRISKIASNLSPLESYKVQGSYAKSRISLYAKEISIALLIILVLAIVGLLIIKVIVKGVRRGSGPPKTQAEKNTPSESGRTFLFSLGLAFISAILITGYTLILIFLVPFLEGNFPSYYQYGAVLYLFIAIISFCIYVLLLFAPSVYLGMNKGVGWGFITLVLTVVWLVIFLIVGFFVVFIFLKPQSIGGRPIPLLESL